MRIVLIIFTFVLVGRVQQGFDLSWREISSLKYKLHYFTFQKASNALKVLSELRKKAVRLRAYLAHPSARFYLAHLVSKGKYTSLFFDV